jgi:hypothetical protein
MLPPIVNGGPSPSTIITARSVAARPFPNHRILDGRPDFTNMRVGVNARLFDDFDLAAVPLKTIDRKNLR